MNDIKSIGGTNKAGLVLLTDGGPDWSPKFLKNNLELGKLWRDQKLDFVIQTTYAPGHSAQNPIEHLWAPLTKAFTWVTGLYLKACLDGEDKAPSEQNLSEEERKEKERVIYDLAIADLNSYWNGKKFNNYTISSNGIACGEADLPENDYDRVLKSGIKTNRNEYKNELDEEYSS